MPTTVNKEYEININYQGKLYQLKIHRHHGVASFPRYMIRFKTGIRKLQRWGKITDKLMVSSGKPLPDDFLQILHQAIKEQIESKIDLKEAYRLGYSVNEEYL